MQIEVESLSPDRTQMWFTDRDAGTHWGIEIITEAWGGRAYYCVTHDGWVVYELTAREVRTNNRGTIATECFRMRKPSEPIPACVMSHLPAVTK